MSRLHQLAINRDGFAFDPTTGESFSLNETGMFILERLIERKSGAEIAQELEDKFQVDAEEAERDVADFVDHLRTHRLV